jgi:hypothetical protein
MADNDNAPAPAAPKTSPTTEEILGHLREIRRAISNGSPIANDLNSIRTRVAAMESGVARLEAQNAEILAMLGQLLAAPAARVVTAEIAPAAVDIASDADLESAYGNPEVRKDPPRWTGQSYAGCRMSDCPPDYLENLASFYDWKAKKDDEANAVDAKGNPKSKWSKLDAARARGHARRNAGKPGRPKAATPKAVEVVPGFDDGDEPPFLADSAPSRQPARRPPGCGLAALKGPASMTTTEALAILLALLDTLPQAEARRCAVTDLLWIAGQLCIGTRAAPTPPTTDETREALLTLRRELDTATQIERHRRLARFVAEQARRAA